MLLQPPRSTRTAKLFPYTTLCRSAASRSCWSRSSCSRRMRVASAVRCFSARLRRLLSIAHASTAASRIGPRIVMKPHSMMCLLYPLDTGTTGGGGEGCMGTWATIVRAGDADGRDQSFDPPCCEADGRWQQQRCRRGLGDRQSADGGKSVKGRVEEG